VLALCILNYVSVLTVVDLVLVYVDAKPNLIVMPTFSGRICAMYQHIYHSRASSSSTHAKLVTLMVTYQAK